MVDVAKNILGQGVRYHLQIPYSESTRWFMISNQFKAWTNYTTTTSPFLDPAASPVHFNP